MTVFMTTFCWSREAALPFGNRMLVLATGFGAGAFLVAGADGAECATSAGLPAESPTFCWPAADGFLAARSLASRLARSSSSGDGGFGLRAALGTILGCLWMRT